MFLVRANTANIVYCICAQGEFWSLREEDAAEYERRLTGRFQERNKKRKTLSVAAQHLIPVEKRSRKKYIRKPGKRADVVRLLAQFSASHKETEERAALANGGVVSAELEALFKNPFKVCPTCALLIVCCDFRASHVWGIGGNACLI